MVFVRYFTRFWMGPCKVGMCHSAYLVFTVYSLNSWYTHIYHNVIFLKTLSSVKSNNRAYTTVGKIGLRLDCLKPCDFITRALTKTSDNPNKNNSIVALGTFVLSFISRWFKTLFYPGTCFPSLICRFLQALASIGGQFSPKLRLWSRV